MKVEKMRVQELNLGVGCLKVPARCVTYLKRCTCNASWSTGGWGVGGGCGNALDRYNAGPTDLLRWVPNFRLSLQMEPEVLQPVAARITLTKDSNMAQVNHKKHIFTKTYYFRGRLWGKSRRAIVAGTQQIDGTWKHLKIPRSMSMLHKKKQQVYQKTILLGLQLEMAS